MTKSVIEDALEFAGASERVKRDVVNYIRVAQPCIPVDKDGDNASPIDDLNACYQRPPIRTFSTGATRDSDSGKNDYVGYLSPLVIEAFGDYMTRHRVQADGSLRDSDNWKLGQPKGVYIKSAFRHFLDLWKEHCGYASRDGIDEALGGLLFNIMGYWLEYLREREAE